MTKTPEEWEEEFRKMWFLYAHAHCPTEMIQFIRDLLRTEREKLELPKSCAICKDTLDWDLGTYSFCPKCKDKPFEAPSYYRNKQF